MATRQSSSSRKAVDPRLVAFGLLTGAAVGVWAGKRAKAWSEEHPAKPGMIDWDRARTVAITMNQEAALSASERARLDSEYYELTQRTIPLVSAHSGMTLPNPLNQVYAFDRVDWINANIDAFRHMFEPIEKLDLFGGNPNAPRVVNVLWSGLNQTVVSAELGMLLGYLARRVLGQYDLALLGREPLRRQRQALLRRSRTSATPSARSACRPTSSGSGWRCTRRHTPSSSRRTRGCGST